MRQGAAAAGQGLAAGPAWALHVSRHVDSGCLLVGAGSEATTSSATRGDASGTAATTLPPGQALPACCQQQNETRSVCNCVAWCSAGMCVPTCSATMARWACTAAARARWRSSCLLWGPTSSQVGQCTTTQDVYLSNFLCPGAMGEWLQAVLVACTLAKGIAVAGCAATPCDRSLLGCSARRPHSAGCAQAVLLCGCSWTPGTCGPGRAAQGSTRLAATTRPQSCLRWQPWPSTSAARWGAAGLATGAAAIGGAAGQWLPTAAGKRACRCCRGFNTLLHCVCARVSRCWQVMYALPHSSDPLDATIGECGAMNLFFVFDKTSSSSGGGGGSDQQLEVVTPPLDGTILPGVTRDSILQLLRK